MRKYNQAYRITSYNVCYTKLLRLSAVGLVLRDLPHGVCNRTRGRRLERPAVGCRLRRLPRGGTAQDRAGRGQAVGAVVEVVGGFYERIGVITSYSIHYTKLYELYGAGFFRYRLFNLHPIARDLVFEHMRDAAIVFDDEGSAEDFNRAAAALFPDLGAERAPKLEGLAARCPGLRGLADGSSAGPATVEVDGDERRFEAHLSRFRIGFGDELGSLLISYNFV